MGTGPKDLRYLNAQAHAGFSYIVLNGKLKNRGMAPFRDVLTPEQVDAIHVNDHSIVPPP